MQWNENKWSYFLVLILGLCTLTSTAQLEASNWYFGFNAGLRFDPVTNAVTPLTNGQLNTFEGCASISDVNGNLLFYTDGITVFDATHQIMQNGQGLLGNPSSAQSAIIIPKPQDVNIYYIFTVDTAATGGADSGLHWYEVDMTANNGLGAVMTNIAAPNNLITTCSEKIAAINHAVNDEILVTALANVNGISTQFDTFYTFTISAAGVNSNPVISPVSSLINDRRGNLKISPDGRYLVSCNMQSGTFLYDFNQLTGAVSNERALTLSPQTNAGYGAEFSPDSSILYVTASNDTNSNNPIDHIASVIQYDLNNPATLNAPVLIDQRNGYRGALQLGIDNRIYRALSDTYNNGRAALGVINNPNVIGPGANYQHDAIPLGGRLSSQGLPPFIQSFFALIEVENTCLGDGTTFSFQSDTPPTAVLWDFDDGTTSTVENPTHVYASPGIYDVTLSLTINGSTRNYTRTIQIFDVPVIANPITNVAICDIGNNGAETIDLSAIVTPQVLGTQDPQLFNVRYFLSQQDAVDNINPISNSFNLTTGSATVYIRIYNSNNADCFNTTSFDLTLFAQPLAVAINDVELCDDDTDGFAGLDLSSLNSTVLGSQSAIDFSVSYHLSQTDADARLNALSSPFTNTTTPSQTIFVRVENVLNSDCADTTVQFNYVVNALPAAFNTAAFQCDEDGTPDGRTIFNLSEFDNTITNNATDVSVSYHINQSDADNNVSPLNNTDYTNTTTSQVIIARVTNDLTGCYSTSQVTLEVSASDAQDAQLESCDDDGTMDGLTEFVLSSADSSVLSSAPPNVTVNYYESLNDALTELNVLPTQYTNTVPGGQIVYARAESLDGNCFGISELTLVVHELPVVEPVDLLDYCGNDPQPLTIDAGALISNVSDYTYSWDTGETTYAIQVSTGGNYAVNVINSNGCSSTRVVTVIISDEATINSIDVVHAGSNATGMVTINASGLGDYEYRISLDEDFQESPVFENLKPGFYTAYIRDINGCGTVRQDFVIIGYPRFFTPNNDGFNDFWQLTGTSFDFESNAQILIFDRYGKLLKQIAADGPGWDGTYNNEPMPSSDYWFKATLSTGFTFSSHFTLKR